MSAVFAFGLGPTEMVILGVVAVLLFGKRLPEVAKSIGQGMKEFKKGLHGIEDEVRSASYRTTSPRYDEIDDRDEATAPKFEPPPAEAPPTPAGGGDVIAAEKSESVG